MSVREAFLRFVRQGGERCAVSVQIGAGAGFDTKLAGKEWISDTTLDDTIAAYEQVGGWPFFNIGLPNLADCVSSLRWEQERQVEPEKRCCCEQLATPYGRIERKFIEQKHHGITPIQFPVTLETADWDKIIIWYAEQYLNGVDYLGQMLKEPLAKLQQHGPVSIQWNVQPFELMGLPSTDTLAMLAMMEKSRYHDVCKVIQDVNCELVRAVFDGGADFVFLGGPGAEMLSPKLYEEFLVPYSQGITQAVHACGGLVYTHICSPIEPMLSRGYYNQMGLDLFETLSPEPVGNVKDLSEARRGLNGSICTRGNVGLDVLLNGTIADVEAATRAVIHSTSGSKHIVAASDYLFYDIPLENVQALVRTAQEG